LFSTQRIARAVRRLFWLRGLRYARIIRRSGLFQPEYYLRQLADPGAARDDPVWHYLVEGAAAGLDPNPLFDTSYYAEQCPESASRGKNPLVHFIRRASLNPNPRFDPVYYLERYPDVRAARMNPLAHYLVCGSKEGRVGFPVEHRPAEIDHSAAVPFCFAETRTSATPSLAVVCHMFHVDLAVEFQRYLSNIGFPFDLVVTTDTPSKRDALERRFAAWPHGAVTVRICENRGRDIAPKLVALRDVHYHYEYVLHLHSKRSSHDPAVAPWRVHLLETLLGTPAIVASVFEAFSSAPRLGMIAAQHFEPIRRWIRWGGNFELARVLAARMGIELDPDAALDFPSGSMFWARSAALRPLLDVKLSLEDFAAEQGQTDGTASHAIERLFFIACEHAGYSWMKVARPELCPRTRNIAWIDSADALRRFQAEHLVTLTAPQPPSRRSGC
jgi:hypothetical protein